jgi:hypothetical protein
MLFRLLIAPGTHHAQGPRISDFRSIPDPTAADQTCKTADGVQLLTRLGW